MGDSSANAGAGASNPSASNVERKYRIALALYVVLAVLVWFTIGEGRVEVFGKLIEMRWIPIFVLAMLVFRTVMAMQVERIRRGSSK
jgi:hypothetical protein